MSLRERGAQITLIGKQVCRGPIITILLRAQDATPPGGRRKRQAAGNNLGHVLIFRERGRDAEKKQVPMLFAAVA